MRYNACVFDFDLTLADSSEGILICFRHTLAAFGYTVPDDRTIYNTIGMPLTDAFDLLSGIPENPRKYEMRDVYVRKADEVMVRDTHFYSGVPEALAVLRERGIKIGICSSKMRYRIEQSFDAKVGSRPFDVLIGLGDAERPKPDPSGLLMCIDRLGISAAETLYIGDNIIDAQTAERAGVDFAAVLTGSTTEEQFSALPNVAICKELSGFLTNIYPR